MFNVVLILLGQHCTGKILVQCCIQELKALYNAQKTWTKFYREKLSVLLSEKHLFSVIFILDQLMF